MTDETEIAFQVQYHEDVDIDAVASEVTELGAEASVEQPEGVIPLAAILAVVVPPGIAIMVKVVSRVVERWKKEGVLIDARTDGPPVVQRLPGTPFGTVVILTQDGQKSERSDIAEEDLAGYIAKALGALKDGASAPEAGEIAIAR